MSRLICLVCSILIFSCKEKNSRKYDTLFSSLKAENTGIHFVNTISEDYTNFFGVYNYAYNGGGVAIGDINNDGLSDIYFSGNQVEDKLYLNKGNFVFEDITAKAGLKNKTSWHNGVVMADVNSDGLLDIYVCKGGWKDSDENRKNLLYINKGNLIFEEQAKQYGINDAGFSMMASFFDADNDNDLDLYVMNRPANFFIGFEEVLKGRDNTFPLYRDKLYINENGHYIEKSSESGITKNFAHGLGVVTSDINNDGNTDIYVANDYNENDYLYENKGFGKFEESITERTNHVAYYGMGVDIFDINNDGLEDIFELDMSPEDYYRSKVNMPSMQVKDYSEALKNGIHRQSMHNVLQLNSSSGFFSEIAQLSGVAKTDWSWSCLGADLDNDSWNDILVTNGFKRDIWNKDIKRKLDKYTSNPSTANKPKDQIINEIVKLFPSERLPNYAFKNNGDLTFDNLAKKWGLAKVSFSNGMATADLDNDGDLDLVINNIDDKAFVYRNNTQASNKNYLKIKFKGPKSNTYGLGTKVTVFTNNTKQYKDFKTVRGYLSSVEPILHFGLGGTSEIDSLLIKWPDGKSQLLKGLKTNQQLEILYTKAKHKNIKAKIEESLFQSVPSEFYGIDFKHNENDYDDFANQILLPHKLSEEGPALEVADINNDGLEDFYVGGAAGQAGVLYIQNRDGKFEKKNLNVLEQDKKHEDVAATFFDADGDHDNDLYVVSGGNEEKANSEYYRDRLYINDGKGNFTKSKDQIPIRSSGSCVVPMDIDSDGDLDLFVGGRHVPWRYPSTPDSFILENQNTKFIDITEEIAPDLGNIGMVTDAQYEDINNDGVEEIVLVGEWMPITIFEKKSKIFINTTDNYGLNGTKGWWNCINIVDFDKDNDMDFFVGNLGQNYKFKASKDKPLGVVASDYDKNGTFDVFLTKKVNNQIVPVRGKECSTQQIPSLAQKLPTFDEFARANLSDILGNDYGKELSAYMFESVYVENLNAKSLKIINLPLEAQFSTINNFNISDFDLNEYNDVLLTGNRFGVELETTPSDASQGLLLKLDAKKNFEILGSKSGYSVKDNVRSTKLVKLASNKQIIITAINNKVLKVHNVKSK